MELNFAAVPFLTSSLLLEWNDEGMIKLISHRRVTERITKKFKIGNK